MTQHDPNVQHIARLRGRYFSPYSYVSCTDRLWQLAYLPVDKLDHQVARAVCLRDAADVQKVDV